MSDELRTIAESIVDDADHPDHENPYRNSPGAVKLARAYLALAAGGAGLSDEEFGRAANHLRSDGRFTFGQFEAAFEGEPDGWAVMRPYINGYGRSDYSILCTGMDEAEARAVATILNRAVHAAVPPLRPESPT